MNRSKIVVWDPQGTLAEGSVLSDGENTRRMELLRGLVTLPYDAELRELGAVGGYAKRACGHGELFDRCEQRRGCTLLVAASQDSHRLHWAARIGQTDAGRPMGTLRVTPAVNVLGQMACSAVPLESPVELAMLGAQDKHGGWTVRGTASLSCHAAGYVSIGLQGIAQNLVVKWFAASVTRGS